MAHVIDLRETDDPEILTSTGSGGLLGTDPILNRPLATRLWPEEDVQYVLRNRNRGLDIERGSDDGIDPGGGYQALAAVTDLRILFVAGRDDRDVSRSVELRDIVTASAESEGFRTSALVVETLADTCYIFACADSVSQVAAYVDDAAAAWGRVERHFDTAERALDEAIAEAENNAYGTALSALSTATDQIEQGRRQVRSMGPGALAAVDERVKTVRARAGRARRRVQAGRGASAHADAQAAWADRDYESAAGSYGVAIESYERAIDASGERPTTASLRERLRGAARERAVLRAAPMADAESARASAADIDDPVDAAAAYETALDRYRELPVLDWGREDRRFLIDREYVRQRATETADAAIDAHRAAAQQWVSSADALVAGDHAEQAGGVYERAADHVRQALRLAREVRPSRVGTLDSHLERIKEYAAAANATGRSPSTGESDDDSDGTGTTSGEAERAEEPDQTATDGGGGRGPTLSATDPGTAAGTGPLDPAPAAPTAPRPAEQADSGDSDNADVTAVLSALRTLDEPSFVRLVVTTWEAEGWSTTVSAVGDATGDVLATRDGERLFVRVVHAPDSGVVPATAVDRCAAARDDEHGGIRAVLVTAGTVTAAVQDRAAAAEVGVIDGETLARRVRAAGLLDRLPL